jgi:DNA-binding transcriptional LysR family regulator
MQRNATFLQKFRSRTTFRQIEIVVRVAECGSMTEVAEELGMSLANVSLTCKRFETNFGARIFFMSKNQLYLDQSAAIIISELKTVLDAFGVFEENISRLTSVQGEISDLDSRRPK